MLVYMYACNGFKVEVYKVYIPQDDKLYEDS